ncbi:MAG: molybdopterin-dependent oxidoreductase [bacterium]|nr:molybdopterin-dependent oxidoreductase [bacterium]
MDNDKKPKSTIVFMVNGKKKTLGSVYPGTMLAYYLRGLGLTGTRIGCGEGGCGSCTVMLSRYNTARDTVEHLAIKSCLTPLCSIDGMAVTTIEGIGNTRDGLDPVQYAIAAKNGSQCGFCTPGIVMNMYTFLKTHSAPTVEAIENLFDGNLCRCTGYRAILHGMKGFAPGYKPDTKDTPDCCIDPAYIVPEKKSPLHPGGPGGPDGPGKPVAPTAFSIEADGSAWHRPADLEEVYTLKKTYAGEDHFHRTMLVVGHTSAGVCNYNPSIFIDISRIEELTAFTEIAGKGFKVGAAVPIQRVIDTLTAKSKDPARAEGIDAFCNLAGQIASLQIRNTGSIGGNIYLAKLFQQYYLLEKNGHEPRYTTFVSDLFTAFAVLGATLTVGMPVEKKKEEKKKKKTKQVVYGMLDIPPLYATPTQDPMPLDAVFLDFFIPYTLPGDYVRTYKTADRGQDGQAYVNAGFRIRFDQKKQVEEALLIFGGIGYNSVAAKDTAAFLKGKTWNSETLGAALKKLLTELDTLAKDRPNDGNTRAYRISLARDLFYRFYLDIAHKTAPGTVKAPYLSGATPLQRAVSSGTQQFPTYPGQYPVGKPMVKTGAFLQAAGEVKYTHDLPLPANGLHAFPLTASHAAATLDYSYMDTEKGKQYVGLPAIIEYLEKRFSDMGFVDFVTFLDVRGTDLKHRLQNNRIGLGKDDPVFTPYVADEEKGAAGEDAFFSNNAVTCEGALIGLVLAENIGIAIMVADFIKKSCLNYTDILQYNYEGKTVPSVYSMESVIDKKDKQKYTFWQEPPTNPLLTHLPGIRRPGSNIGWLKDPVANPLPGTGEVSGTQRCGGQAHFYLETQSALVIPNESNHLTIYVSTQNPSGNQAAAAQALELSANMIEVKVHRIGGGFGGKQTRSAFISTPAAIAAWKHKRPVKIELFRNTDTTMVGKRHPFSGTYRLAYERGKQENVWKIKGINNVLNSDGGNTYDQSFPVMDLALLHGDNVYNAPTFQNEGFVYRTNRASNTAFRSFGTVQSLLVQENAIEHMAFTLSKAQGKKILPEDIREQNFYKHYPLDQYAEAPETPFGQELLYCNIGEIWKDLMESSQFRAREKKIEEFNKNNLWKKRGISMIPLKYGISYTGTRGTLNQGYALVNVYQVDGSVLVVCGGIEMGQGLNTKMAQLAAQTLGIPIEKIRVGGTNSSTVPNATATAASTGSDLNGGAVVAACKKLRKRLEQFCLDLEQYTPHKAVENWRVDWPGKWDTIVTRAYVNRINLSSQGHYKTTHFSPVAFSQHPEKEPGKRFEYRGHPFFYFTYSAGVSEVEIDVLTGELTVLRSDILFDAGKSLNPCLDVGQIEGAFVQGLGYLTTENLEYTAAGNLITNRTWNYKPPFSKNIPVDFRIRLGKDKEPTTSDGIPLANTAVKSSKGIGEPPFVLAVSVFFAVKHAVLDARKDQGNDEWLEMDAPATPRRIKAGCGIDTGNLKL